MSIYHPSYSSRQKYVQNLSIEVFRDLDLFDRIIEFVRGNMSPNEIFDSSELEYWATDNGFVRVE